MEQKLQDNNNKINEFKKSEKLLIKGLEKQKRINELKIKENNDLSNEIKKLEKLRIKLGGLPKLLEENKAPLDKDEETLKNLATRLKLESTQITKDFDSDKYFRYEEK